MIKTTKKEVFALKSFSQVPGLVHGFSTREFGTMIPAMKRSSLSFSTLAQALGAVGNQVIGMDQVHGNKVVTVGQKECDTIIEKTDGLVTTDKNTFLCVTFADCVPVLFYDLQKKIVAAAHAGWKGALQNIVKNVVLKMQEKGSDAKDVLVGIGPSIRSCCYTIDSIRADLFMQTFPEWKEKILKQKEDKIFLNLQDLLALQLNSLGIKEKHIEDCAICTKDSSEFYSYRRDAHNGNFGVCAAIIGRKY